MAVAVDAVSSSGGGSASSFSWAHTCSGSDRLLMLGIAWYDSIDTISSVTYNSVAMTIVPSSSKSIGQYTVVLYYLINPASGSNTVAVTFSGGVFDFGGGAVSFTGADQTTPLGTAATASGTSTTPSVAVTSASGEIVLDTLIITHSGTLTVDGSQTQRWNATGGGYTKYAGSTEGGAASTTMSWSNSTSQDWAITGVAVKPVSANTVRQLCLIGVGN